MSHDISSTILPRNTALTLRADVHGVVVSCRAGTCWVTEEGDVHDYVLRPGHSHHSRGRRLVVLCALSDAEVDIGRPSTRA